MLDKDLLEKVQLNGNKLIAQCPACAEMGGDNTGNHLVIFDKGHGRWGCVAHQDDKTHNKRIYELAGDKNSKSTNVSSCSSAKKKRRRQSQNLGVARREKQQHIFHEKLTSSLSDSLNEILEPYLTENWREQFLESSPVSSHDLTAHNFLKGLFLPSDNIWLGGSKYDSGRVEHSRSFKPLISWLEIKNIPPRISTATFKKGSFARSQVNVLENKYLIIESDELIGKKPETLEERELNKKLSAALVLCLCDNFPLKLRAVIDTGNKSLHAWFDRPTKKQLQRILEVSEGLKIDTLVIKQSATMAMRFIGCHHEKTGNTAELIYLNPKHSN